jgi:hypothetical protein
VRSIITGILLLIQCFCLNAQNNVTIKYNGTVIDSLSRKPVALASVALRNSDGKTLKSTVTTDKGVFILPVILSTNTTYHLMVSYVGYESRVIPLVSGISELGMIVLAASSTPLNNVTVNATKPLVKQEIDRLVYDVQADAQAKGQTAMDMLRRVPLITVDGDDNIQLQGSGNYRIFINGKPSALVTNNPKDVLRTMPANVIQKIEVITTPPAKYDAEGLAGIINIVTVKKTADGYNGSVTLRENLPFGPGLNLTLTAKQDKFGLSVFGGGNMRVPVTTHNENLRNTYGSAPATLFQDNYNRNRGFGYYTGSELSYEVDSLQLLTASFNYFGSPTKNTVRRNSSYYVPSGTVMQSYDLLNEGEFNFNAVDLGLNYQLGFKHKKEQLLTTSYRYSYSLSEQLGEITSSNKFNYTQPDNTQQNDAGSKEHTLQLDYVNPIKKLNIEAGAKAILRTNYSNTSGEIYLSPSAGYVNDPSRTNNFNYQLNVYSLYNSYQLKLTKWTFQVGLRAEHTTVNADFASTGTKLDMSYTNFIPSFLALRSLKNNSTLSFGITNRLMRPGINLLNPFIDKGNVQIINTGNPNLRPVISHLFELSYNKIGKKGSMNLRASYMYINNSVESVTSIIADTISYTTYENVGQNKILRFNINGNYQLTPKLSMNFNTGIFYVWITGTYNGRLYSNSGPRTNTFLNTTYKPNGVWQFGLSGGYNRRYINLQGGSNDYYYYSVSATCNLKKFTFSAVLNNPLFKLYEFTQYNDSPDFYQSNKQYLIYRNVNLSVTYKFGKLSSGLKKNKRGINNDDAAAASN